MKIKMKNGFNRIQNYSLAGLLVIPFVGLALPYGFPLFPMVAVIVTIMFLFFSEINIYDMIINTSKISVILIPLSLFVLAGLYWYDESDYLLRNDIKSTMSLLMCAVCLMLAFQAKVISLKTIEITIKIYSHIIFLVCILSIVKSYLMLHAIYLVDPSIYGTSLSIDYNMYSLALVVAMFTVISSTLKPSLKFLYITIYSCCILFTSSRRGSLLVVVILLALFFYYTIYFINHSQGKLRFNKKIAWIILSVISILASVYSYKTVTSYELSEQLTNQVAIPHKVDVKVYEYGKSIYAQYMWISRRLQTIISSGNTGVYYQRVVRFEQTVDLLSESSFEQILLGQGFSYHEYFKEANNTDVLDYPHNLLLSTLLFQGMLGFLVVCYLLAKTTVYSIKLYELPNCGWLAYTNLVCILYMLTGGDSLVSNKYYIVLSMIIILLYKTYEEKLTEFSN
ncbi:O-antigen ligase family protein [Aliivibrio salmonicida]|uniref:O-antigen ligase family protein n=1 Tax=Aliivibrio salmonicida TaxID=40269 RepID=UPI00406CB85F